MRIALVGTGKMGREIEVAARDRGGTVIRRFDSKNPITAKAIADVDVCIDFSSAAAVPGNVGAALEAGKDIVIGTTGWQDHLEEIRPQVIRSGLLYSANFSLGMNVFMRIVARAAVLMQNQPDYDPFIHELHHRQKADAPSGTALRLAELLIAGIERKRKIVANGFSGKIESDGLHVTSPRAGFITGTHLVGFDSEADAIELRHTAKNRRGFALGALTAAHWLRGRRGVFTMDDVEL
jgi:4-hydroxy-tetrahydrodipicolinate reductase